MHPQAQIRGIRQSFGHVVVEYFDGKWNKLPKVNIHANNFEWGYVGEGPSDLAASMLALALGAEVEHVEVCAQQGGSVGSSPSAIVLKLYIAFRNEFVTKFSRDGWCIPVSEILEWVSIKEDV